MTDIDEILIIRTERQFYHFFLEDFTLGVFRKLWEMGGWDEFDGN